MTTYDDIAADEHDRALRDYAELERTCRMLAGDWHARARRTTFAHAKGLREAANDLLAALGERPGRGHAEARARLAAARTVAEAEEA